MKHLKSIFVLIMILLLGSCIATMSIEHVRGAFDDTHTFTYAQPAELRSLNEDLESLGCETCIIDEMMYIYQGETSILIIMEFHTIDAAVQYQSLFNDQLHEFSETFEVMRRRDNYILLTHDMDTMDKAIKGR